MSPAVGCARPVAQWIRVDLPAPFGPSRPKNSPAPISSETLLSASVPVGYCLTRSWISSAGAMGCAGDSASPVAFQWGCPHVSRNLDGQDPRRGGALGDEERQQAQRILLAGRLDPP